MGVGVCPLDDPEWAIRELEFALELGLEAIWVPHRAPIDISPGHVDLEGFWARLAESGTPFVLHVGGSPLHSLKAWMTRHVATGILALLSWLPHGFWTPRSAG